MPLIFPRPMSPRPVMTALQKISVRGLILSSKTPTNGLTMPDSSCRSDIAPPITVRDHPKCASIGRMKALSP